jgi:Sulfotransferase domain
MNKEKKIIFIFSTGRTGTLFLSHVLSSLPTTFSEHEAWFRALRIWQELVFRGKFLFLSKLLIPSFDVLKLRKNIFFQFQINPPFKSCINELVNYFPNATYIYLVRDPRDYVRSGINWSLGKKFNKFLKIYFPFWITRPSNFFLGKSDIDRLFEIHVENWIIYNNLFLKNNKKFKNHHILKFENLKMDSICFTNNILKLSKHSEYNNFVLLKNICNKSIKKSKNSSLTKFPCWSKWDSKYLIYLHKKCDRLMKIFGYGDEQEWREKINKIIDDK